MVMKLFLRYRSTLGTPSSSFRSPCPFCSTPRTQQTRSFKLQYTVATGRPYVMRATNTTISLNRGRSSAAPKEEVNANYAPAHPHRSAKNTCKRAPMLRRMDRKLYMFSLTFRRDWTMFTRASPSPGQVRSIGRYAEMSIGFSLNR